MSDVVIQVDGVWKKYRLGVLGTGTLRHDFNRWLHRTLGKGDPYAKVGEGQKSEAKGTKKADRSSKIAPDLQSPISDLPPPASSLRDDEMWALRDVSFEVKQGEILGIIGRNGAGKSTLLKILSRVTVPTSGEVRVKGRIASLLEVGTGFHPELTGRENIFLNGAILGMTKGEIKKKFDEIVAFSEVEKFIDTPVKRYSSGMYVRLAFAVAAHLDPEVLIVDEVLAVGDADFQKKCLGKMQDVAGHGRTILFVSHNMHAVSSLCQRALLLNSGCVTADGLAADITAKYLLGRAGPDCGRRSWADPETAPGTHEIRLRAVGIRSEDGLAVEIPISKPFSVEVEFQVLSGNPKVSYSIHLLDHYGNCVLATANMPSACVRPDPWFGRNYAPGLYRARCHFPANFLNEGRFSIRVILLEDMNTSSVPVCLDDALSFTAVDSSEMRKEYFGHWIGLVRPKLAWDSEQLREGGEPAVSTL